MSKSTLNTLTTIFGLAAGAATFLGNIGAINRTIAGTIGGLATAALGYLVQQPAVEQPQAPTTQK
ncbi:hypothetical protein [Nostoc sp. DSM 114167]|jgi:energy-converting hydrogenase Eha subunit B|uniref:hypothetical protein n=1 Tax=Nostoc sp. DSM 114167 TaxID=3439050 RepID=UPI00404561D3